MDEIFICGHLVDQNPTISSIDRFKNIKKQQQLFLYIRHASQCFDVCCSINTHCNKIKRLISHTKQCKNASCSFNYCQEAFLVLSHYKNCPNKVECSICGPLQETIRLNKFSKKVISCYSWYTAV